MRRQERIAPRPPRIAPRAKKTLPFYQSAEWKALVAQVIKLRGRRCQDCGSGSGRIYADHVKELRDGGAPLNPMNIWLRCSPCHGAKTEARRRERAGLRPVQD
ncbi:HNH endonuclease [Novosphingobium aromaticivorans DSM 12444]|uniref:HNH endonuclease n=1 Tax=Novosphingobium aromaticivorans (strain ATCC 700278 / DSM 12444 / CCUG 56034 / CIP 105152 / NBRC 16084 / F199) TaxID=279238 RepID=Q2GAN2_NOVAD|nr:HNH endonuclease [Novosphingobium aromaticivorans DSM 12444]